MSHTDDIMCYCSWADDSEVSGVYCRGSGHLKELFQILYSISNTVFVDIELQFW